MKNQNYHLKELNVNKEMNFTDLVRNLKTHKMERKTREERNH